MLPVTRYRHIQIQQLLPFFLVDTLPVLRNELVEDKIIAVRKIEALDLRYRVQRDDVPDRIQYRLILLVAFPEAADISLVKTEGADPRPLVAVYGLERTEVRAVLADLRPDLPGSGQDQLHVLDRPLQEYKPAAGLQHVGKRRIGLSGVPAGPDEIGPAVRKIPEIVTYVVIIFIHFHTFESPLP